MAKQNQMCVLLLMVIWYTKCYGMEVQDAATSTSARYYCENIKNSSAISECVQYFYSQISSNETEIIGDNKARVLCFDTNYLILRLNDELPPEFFHYLVAIHETETNQTEYFQTSRKILNVTGISVNSTYVIKVYLLNGNDELVAYSDINKWRNRMYEHTMEVERILPSDRDDYIDERERYSTKYWILPTEDGNCNYEAFFCRGAPNEGSCGFVKPLHVDIEDDFSIRLKDMLLDEQYYVYVNSIYLDGIEEQSLLFNVSYLCKIQPETCMIPASKITVVKMTESINETMTICVEWLNDNTIVLDSIELIIDPLGEYERVTKQIPVYGNEGCIDGVPLFYLYNVFVSFTKSDRTVKEGTLIENYILTKRVAEKKAFWTKFLIAITVATACLLITFAILIAKRRNREKHFDPEIERNKLIEKDLFYKEHLMPRVKEDLKLDEKALVLGEILGEGAFGVVRKGYLFSTCKEVAVKMLKTNPTYEEKTVLNKEMETMSSIGSHPNLLSMLGCVCTTRHQFMLVVEYCSLGDLQNYLRCAWEIICRVSKEEKLTEENAFTNKLYGLSTQLTATDLLSFCRQIAMGMEYLSQNRIVHRDLAARNILVCEDKSVKIADFGLSRDIYQENLYKKKSSGKLPYKWMAIESLTHQIYTTHSDVWSFGIVLWEIATLGGTPYPGISSKQLLAELKGGYRMPRPPNCSQQIYNLMIACWQPRPKDRPTFTELYNILDELLRSESTTDYLTLEISEVKSTEKMQYDKIWKHCKHLARYKTKSTPSLRFFGGTKESDYVGDAGDIARWGSTLPNHYCPTPK